MIRLQYVQITNFGSWESLHFTLENQGITILTGDTGAGKSTIFRAIYWCLFGKTPEGHRVHDLVRHRQKWCAVQLGLEKTTETATTQYVISRFRNHPDWKNKVYVSGSDIPKIDQDSLVDDSQKWIDYILGFSEEVFAKVFYFVQRDARRFSSLTDNERKLFLESITYGDLLQRCERTARETSRILRNKIAILLARQEARRDTLRLIKEQSAEEQRLLQEAIEDVDQEERVCQHKLLSFRRKYEGNIEKWITLLADSQKRMHFNERAVKDLQTKQDICPVCATRLDKQWMETRRKVLLDEIELEKVKIENLTKSLDAYDRLRDDVFRAQEKRAKLQDQLASHTREIPGVIRKQSKEDQKAYAMMRNQQAYTDYWVKGFGSQGLRAYVLNYTVQQVNLYLNTFLSMIDDSLQASLKVDSKRVVLTGTNDRGLPTLSGGERQALDLSLGLSLRLMVEHNHEAINSLILDEPFEGLDPRLQISSQRILPELQKESVFLITHSDYTAKFDHRYHVEKINGISQMQSVRG